MNQTKIKKETKNKIRVDFERTSAWTRFKIKYLSVHFLGTAVWWLFRFMLLLGISFVILYPFFTKIASSFMSYEDLVDTTVKLVPKYPNLDRYRLVIYDGYYTALFNTLWLSLSIAVIQTFICSFIGYGFAKFKFKGNGLLFALVIFTMIVPHNAMKFAMFMRFRYFDIGYLTDLIAGKGLIELIFGKPINMINTVVPMYLLSLTGLGFKNGLYIFMMRQFFRGVPDELEESAYIDGSGVFHTFFTIILPMAGSMMITIFLFSFSWQWTDYFYTNLFIQNGKNFGHEFLVMSNFYSGNITASTGVAGANNAAASLMIIAPLIILYLFGQRYLIQGIERSGITG